ncbi:glycoside hydrolase family 19 [Aggregatibacter aphrophilus]|uniref:glycoside hydrolase family 19 n=1 Tax=Aggregatibacter aphrophilus TaxID=732 RepID=UPI00194DFEC1|nr:glycoside hydrolase family 19 [Aggregatibacter aphrophilus]
MSEQKKKETPETTKIESPKIPNVAYPLKPRGNVTNLSQQYFNHLAGDESARFLFNNSGLWHQGIHLRASKFPSSEFENDKICAIADGKLIAYKVDSEYKKDNSKAEAPMEGAVYSTGYFLVKHEVAYPKENVLMFYSLYRHTAKLGDYKSGIEKIVGVTKSADNKIVIRDAQNHPLNPRVELNNGVTIGVRRQTQTQDKFDELLWYRETKDNKTTEHKPKTGERWRIFHQSYEVMQSEQIKGLPLLSKHKIDTQADVEVKLNKPIEIKAGEALGLMGEYNQAGESGEKLLHLEVFTYDNIEQFKAKAEAAYKQDREKKGIKDNFLYVARDSQLYTVLKDEVVELEKTQVEIMVPLADVAKQTVKKKTDKTGKDYYNVQPYLYSLVQKNKDGGIYVDDSHLTHGLLFPGVNVFNQAENGLCIFKHGLHQYIDPKSDLTIEQKNELDPMFKSIMDELDLDKDKNAAVSFEAGKLKDLLLSPVQQRRLTGIVAKHDSEWKKTRAADFIRTCGTYRDNNKEDSAMRIEKRVEDLSIKLEVDGFNTDKQAYYLHPLGMIGWLMPYSTCFCHRDFTVNEVKNIIQQLRDSEPSVKKMLGYSLFSASNCNIPASEATYENFTKELNIAMKKYDINTCLRKIHFLAQCYHESAHFSTSQELGSEKYLKGKPYYPYIGRGIIQLTHSGETADAIGYKQYFEYIGRNDYKTNYALLNQDLHLAVDASGYFWKRGKLLNAGDLLSARYPNPSGVKVKYQKTKLSTHTTIDINLVADDDNTRQVTFLVNGGQYAIEERISYVNELKRIFNYESNHLKK